jgi:S1-C subfamily serine protease
LSEGGLTTKRLPYSLVVAAVFFVQLQLCPAKDSSALLKQFERNSISLELEFSRKSPNGLERIISLLGPAPNAYATAFFVGDGLVITAYHVVSGDLDISKRAALGFGRKETLNVKVYTKGCQAKVLSFDKEADLALLQVCGSNGKAGAASFHSTERTKSSWIRNF